MTFNYKHLIKNIFIFYILLIPIAPVIFSNIRFDYIIFLILACLLPFIIYKINFKFFSPFIAGGILSLLSSAVFVLSGQIGDVSYLFINLFAYIRIVVIVIFSLYFLNSQTIQKEKLFQYFLISLSLLVLIAFIQSMSPNFNQLLTQYYASEYKIDLFDAIFAQENYRLTSTIGHPAGIGIAAISLFAVSISFLLFNKYKIRQLYIYIFLMFLALYVGISSGSKLFYVALIIYIFYIAIEQKAFVSVILILLLGAIFTEQIVYLLSNDHLTYVYNLIKENGFFAILETRFGAEGLLTTETLPYLFETMFVGSGLFNASGVFYGDNLYFMLILRFSVIGMLGFLFYFIYFIFKLHKQYVYNKQPMTLAISHIFFLMLIGGVGLPTLITTRISELFAVLWAIGIYIIHTESRKVTS